MVGHPSSHVLSLCSGRGSFINTAMTCSHTGGMEGGAEGVVIMGMVSGGLAWGVEASGARGSVRRHKSTRGSGHGGG